MQACKGLNITVQSFMYLKSDMFTCCCYFIVLQIDLKQKRAITSTEGKKYAQNNKFKYVSAMQYNSLMFIISYL